MSSKHTELIQQVAERLAEAIFNKDLPKAKLTTERFLSVCDRMANGEALPDDSLTLPAKPDECWRHLVEVARVLTASVCFGDQMTCVATVIPELEEIGKAKAQTPEVVERLAELKRIRARMNQFIMHARIFVWDVESLYGCKLDRIKIDRGQA
jgi:hypothetical protein